MLRSAMRKSGAAFVAALASKRSAVFAMEAAPAAAAPAAGAVVPVLTGPAAKIAAAKATYGVAPIAFLQVAPPVLAQFLFLSPLMTMKEIKEKKTTGDMPLLPYTMMTANGFLWCTYGFLTGDFTIMAANVSALVMGGYYVKTFMNYKQPNASVGPAFAAAGAAVAVTAGLASGMLVPEAEIIDRVGQTGVAVVIMMFGGPLASIKKVIAEKNTASLPLPMAVATTANCLAWTMYGLIIQDFYIYFPNAVGLASGLAQLALFARFGVAKAATATVAKAAKAA
ncbi:Sugar transporter SWEET1 [Diplonema papillatum]|nr:Sugar transporter SWEET1 [Diplonema papillatum]|eukprot:gene22104-33907_t